MKINQSEWSPHTWDPHFHKSICAPSSSYQNRLARFFWMREFDAYFFIIIFYLFGIADFLATLFRCRHTYYNPKQRVIIVENVSRRRLLVLLFLLVGRGKFDVIDCRMTVAFHAQSHRSICEPNYRFHRESDGQATHTHTFQQNHRNEYSLIPQP